MKKKVFLVLNVGSSSVKFQVFGFEPDLLTVMRGIISDLKGNPYATVTGDDGSIRHKVKLPPNCTHKDTIKFILDLIEKSEKKLELVAVGHRVVHGGSLFERPVLLTKKIIRDLQALSLLAPFHQPQNIQAIEIIVKLHPDIPQVACFDTSWHLKQKPVFTTYAVPQNLSDQGIRRYGFHGLSYEWIAHVLDQDYPELTKAKVIVAHLGSGASVCAMKEGKSIDTTTGMTTLAGLPMGTRCGDLDPGVVMYMNRELACSIDEIEYLLHHGCGLKGLSGISGDVRVLIKEQAEKAKFALEYFELKVAQHIAMMAISLGGIDALIFTGGIGENQPEIRDGIAAHLTCLMPFRTLVVPANEEYIIATRTKDILRGGTICHNH